MKRFLGLLLGVSILALLLWRLGVNEMTHALGDVRPVHLTIYLFLAAAGVVGYSLRWQLVARGVGQAPPLLRLTMTRLAGDAVGNLIPSGKLAGEPVRVALLRSSGVAGAEAGAGVAVDRLIEAMGNMICAAAYTTVFTLTRGGAVESAPFLLVAAVLMGLFALGVPLLLWREGRRPLASLHGSRTLRDRPRLAPWLSALERMEDRLIEFMRGHAEKVFLALLASLAIEMLLIVEYRELLAAFGVSMSLPTLLLVLLGTGAARLAPTPAGLGAMEATQVGALALAGGRPETGLVVGLVLRLHETLWMLVGLVVLYVQGSALRGRRSSTASGRLVA